VEKKVRREWSPTANKVWEDDWRKRRLMDWLCTPPSERVPRAKTQLAAELKVSTRTLENWSQDQQFRTSWDRRSQDIIGDPDRAHHVLDALYQTAIDPRNRGQVSAAKLYLEAVKAIQPKRVELTLKKPGELSEEELDALLAQAATQLHNEAKAIAELPPAST